MITSGQILKQKRNALGKTVFEVSQETRIQEKYIKALENNEFSEFDSPVFIKGFIKIYSEYIGLDPVKIIALYRRTSEHSSVRKDVKLKKSPFRLKKMITPTMVIITAILLIVASLISYLYIQFNKLNLMPTLTITEPTSGQTVNTDQTTIKGTVDDWAEIYINNERVQVVSGEFTKDITLTLGLNDIKVEARNPKKEGLNVSSNIQIIYAKKEEVKGEKEATSFTVYVKIEKEPAWVQLNIDGRQVFAQVFSPRTTQKYDVKEEVQFVSGKPNTTKIYVNDKLTPLSINSETGIASLSCVFESGLVNCQ